MKKISVIVPAFNVQDYVNKCIQSILNQSYTNMEIIIINDGSTDDTLSLIKNFEYDTRVKVINQANAGVSAARNAGIDAATGDYLAFVDSDDYIEPDMYEKLVDAVIQNNADMAVCNYNMIFPDKIIKQYSKINNQTIDVQADVYSYFVNYCACPKPNNYIVTRLYKTDVVKNSNVRFEKYSLGDDTLFNFKLLPYTNKVTFIPHGLYNYLQRTNSNVYTAAKKISLAKVYADTFESLVSHYTENGFNDYLEVLPVHAYSRLRSIFFYSRLSGLEDEQIWDDVVQIFKSHTIGQYLTGS